MIRSVFIGLDPGKTGAAACLYCEGGRVQSLEVLPFAKATEADLAAWLAEQAAGVDPLDVYACLEKVNSSPGWGRQSCFKFGQSYGLLRGLLVALSIPFETVAPGVWQRSLGCLSKGDKRRTKAKAQELYPGTTHTQTTADAVLIAEYARRSST